MPRSCWPPSWPTPYSRAGYSTILVRPGEKRPLGPWTDYQKRQRTEADIIEARRHHPLANIGIVCGKVSGITALDLDGAKGLQTFSESLSSYFPPTRRHLTPSGGNHLIYGYHPSFYTGAAFLPGVDVRNDGGYIVAPPSVVRGKPYLVINDLPLATILAVPPAFTRRTNTTSRTNDSTYQPPPGTPGMVEMAQAVRPSRVQQNADPKWRYQMPCPLPSHPGDWDKDAGSFYIDATESVYKCFGCDQGPGSDGRGNGKKLYRLLFGKPPRVFNNSSSGRSLSDDHFNTLLWEADAAGDENHPSTQIPIHGPGGEFTFAEMQAMLGQPLPPSDYRNAHAVRHTDQEPTDTAYRQADITWPFETNSLTPKGRESLTPAGGKPRGYSRGPVASSHIWSERPCTLRGTGR